MTRMHTHLRPSALLLAAICIICALWPQVAASMELSVTESALVLSGPVIEGDIQRIETALAQNPGVKNVVLRKSWGGHVISGYRIGERIRELGLSTVGGVGLLRFIVLTHVPGWQGATLFQ